MNPSAMSYRVIFKRGTGVFLLLAATLASGCSPTIKVATPDPVKIDVNMKVDVYTKTDPRKQKEEVNQMQAAIARRNRMAEVQSLKNDRLIGEDREGYLAIRKVPDDPKYAEYEKSIVNGENNDRAVIYLATAEKDGKPMEMVQRDYAKLWRDRSFPGEWIQKDDGTWIQK